jgi:surfeit locus 1 family protein
MHFRRPQLIPLLFIIVSTLLLGGLGVWQLERLQWKNAVLAAVEAKQSEPALGTLPQTLDGIDYHRVLLTGTFLHDKQLHLIGRQIGQDVGYFLLVPFSLEDVGRIILVNRGFSPPGKEVRREGVQTVRGIIRPLREKRLFAPANDAAKNIWFYEDIPAMREKTGLPIVPLVVEATGEATAGEYPIPNDGKFVFRNDHLGYAITWFALALAGLVMFAFYHRKPTA